MYTFLNQNCNFGVWRLLLELLLISNSLSILLYYHLCFCRQSHKNSFLDFDSLLIFGGLISNQKKSGIVDVPTLFRVNTVTAFKHKKHEKLLSTTLWISLVLKRNHRILNFCQSCFLGLECFTSSRPILL